MARYGKPIKNKRRVDPRYHLHEGNALDYTYDHYGDHTNKGAGYEHTAGRMKYRDLQKLQDDVAAFYRTLPYPAHKQLGKYGLVGAGTYVQQYMKMNPDAHEDAVTDFIEDLMDQARGRDLEAKNMNESKQPTIKNLMKGLKNYSKGEQ